MIAVLRTHVALCLGIFLDLSLLYAMNCMCASKCSSSSKLVSNLVFCQRNLVCTSSEHCNAHQSTLGCRNQEFFRSAFLSQTKKAVWMWRWILCLCDDVCVLKLFLFCSTKINLSANISAMFFMLLT